MSIYILIAYKKACDKTGSEPTWEGLKKYKNSIGGIKYVKDIIFKS